jgi:hypothetical protein
LMLAILASFDVQVSDVVLASVSILLGGQPGDDPEADAGKFG